MNDRHHDVAVDRTAPIGATPRSSPRRAAHVGVVVIAYLTQAVFGVLVSVSGLVMPMGAVYLLGLFWIAGVAVMIHERRRPALMIAVPIVSWVAWFVVLWVGDTWWGWTA